MSPHVEASPGRTEPRPARRSRRRAVSAAAAAILLAGLPAMAIAQTPSVASPSAAPPSAVTSPAAASPAAAPLFQVTVAAADRPPGDAVVGLGWFQLDAASSVASPPGSQPPSVAVELVLSGEYDVTTSGRAQVLRGGAPAPDASPGVSIQLGPGDAVVYLDNADTEQLAQTLGDAPVLAIAAGVFATATTAQATPSVTGTWHFEFLDFADAATWATMPPGAVTLTLTREATAPADPPPAGTLRLSGTVPGQEGVFVLSVASAPAG